MTGPDSAEVGSQDGQESPDAADRTALLAEAALRPPGDEVSISTRDLLALWGAKRRGFWTVAQIERELANAGLATDPPFSEGWLDGKVRLVHVDVRRGVQEPAALYSLAPDTTPVSAADVSLRVGSLSAANHPVVSVSPQDSLERAQSLMLKYDYSQLAVMNGTRNLRGAVTWESMAVAQLLDAGADLIRAIDKHPEVVRSSDDLLQQIPRIVDAGFVFVQGFDGQITGIVTTADLSQQFAALATPFFVLAEIERRLRRIVDRAFSPRDLEAAVDPVDKRRVVSSAADLSLGEYIRLLERPESWKKLGFPLDRKEFVGSLEEVRATRNEVMHFSPDPLDDGQIEQLERFLKWLRKLDPDG